MDSTHNPLTAAEGSEAGAVRPPEPKEGLPEYVLDDPAAQLEEPPAAPQTGITVSQYALLVAAGAFATTFAQQRVLANYPTLFLLKNHFHLKKEEIALFFLWATFAWNLKPIAGIFTDAFPLLGTRRRHYMMLGAGLAGVLWLVMGRYDHAYTPLLMASIGVNIATVFASTVMGGLMVEAGQAFGSPGRISSLRQFVQSVSGIAAPTLGGWLAEKAFGWKATTGIAAGAVISLAVLTFFVLRERPVRRETVVTDASLERPDYRLPIGIIIGMFLLGVLATACFLSEELRKISFTLYALLATGILIVGLVFIPTKNPTVVKAQWQLVQILQSRTLWMAVVMLLLVYTVPGFHTALTFQQSDILKFSPAFIGNLDSLGGIFGVVGAAGYAIVCRKINLRVLIIGSMCANGLATLLFLVYNGQTASLTHGLGGFVGVLSELALMDLAVRSTPKGCEALGFALMMSIRNFGIALSDVLGSKMMDDMHMAFNTLVIINVLSTFVVLAFVPFLPRLIVSRTEAGSGPDLINRLLFAGVGGLILGFGVGYAISLTMGSGEAANEMKDLARNMGALIGMGIVTSVAYLRISKMDQAQKENTLAAS